MTVSLQDIARIAGVSPATVSRTLNGNYPVASETQARIRAAMEELGYDPQTIPQRVHEQKKKRSSLTKNIGLILGLGDERKKFSDPFWSCIIDGANQEACQREYHLRFTFNNEDLTHEYQRRLIHSSHIDGLLLVGNIQHLNTLPIAPEFTIGVECGWEPPLRTDIVAAEKRVAMLSLMDHLIALGYRRFCFIGGDFIDERAAAFSEALLRAQLPLPPTWFIQTPWNTEGAYAVARELLHNGGAPFDVLVCACDAVAIGVMRAASACGLRVPDDLAVTGFDDISFARDVDPALTTIHVEKESLGRCAVRRLIERIEGVHTDFAPTIQLVPSHLVLRRSCGAS